MTDEEIDRLAGRIAHHLQNTFSCRECGERVEHFAVHHCCAPKDGDIDETIAFFKKVVLDS